MTFLSDRDEYIFGPYFQFGLRGQETDSLTIYYKGIKTSC
jgi:hypothetical protein